MTSLPQLVKFRSLADQLDDSEFIEFMNMVVSDCGRDVILMSLFHQFADETRHTFVPETLTTLVEIVENIIRKRECEQEIESGSVHLEFLPFALIGEIGSYLNQKEHVDFSKCSRCTYLGCNSPNTLQKLDLTQSSSGAYLDINPLKYPQVSFLAVELCTIQHMIEFVFPTNQDVFPCLTKLEIRNQHMASGSNANIDCLLDCNAIQWNHITHLALYNFASEWSNPKDKMLKLFSKFSNLIYLRLDNVDFDWKEDKDDDDHLWEQILPKIQILENRRSNTVVTDSIIRSRCNQLKALSLSEGQHNLPDDLDFTSLIELECEAPFDDGTSNSIRSLMGSLKRIHFDLKWGSLGDSMKLVLDALSCPNIEEYVICAWISGWNELCVPLERKVFELMDTERKCLRLKMVMQNDNKVDASDIVFQISGILNRLHESKIDEYNVALQCPNDNEVADQDWESDIAKFKARNASKYDVSFTANSLNVTRKDSKMSGCVENDVSDGWLLNF